MQKVITNKTKTLLYILPFIALSIFITTFLLINHENGIYKSSAVSGSQDYTLTLQDDTSISIDFVGDPLILNLQPTATGNFTSGDVQINVSTNSYYGYNLSMSATSTSLSGSVAVGNEKPTIPTLESATAEESFPTGYWGFKRGTDTNRPDTEYQPMLANASIPINLVGDNGNSNGDTSTVTFGVKLDNRTPSGTYDITINFLAVANINTPYYMQNITDAELANLMPSVNDSYTLTDSRDNKQYTVAKLKDGQYWMTTNLDLAGGTTLTPQDSNVTANYTLPESSKTGFDDNSKAFVYNSGSTDCSSANGCYSYYSWNAATAMSGTSITTANTDAPSSICPAGWHLPTTRRNENGITQQDKYDSDFIVMTGDYGLTDMSGMIEKIGAGTTPNFYLAGYYTVDGNYYGREIRGIYWSSTYFDETSSLGLDFGSSYTFPEQKPYNHEGGSVRCIHNATMQNLTDTEVAAMNTNETKVLYDSRDNQRYTATKLLDGKLWMTKNLNLAGGTTLTSADTDMPAGYILPTANGFGANNTLPASSKTGFSDNTQAYVFNSNSTDCSSADGCYSYYSWNAATLGSGVNITTDNTDAPYSICPKGWKLPTSRSTLELAQTSSDYYQMAIHYGLNPANTNENPDNTPKFCNEAGDGGNCVENTIPNFLRAGNYYGTILYYAGEGGYYWSSTAGGGNTLFLDFSPNYVSTSSEFDRNAGVPVRCLYDSSMQNFTTTDASAMDEYDELQLTDRRDGNTYTVAKINGNTWMTQNLRFTGTTLTPADSNVTTDTTMTYYSLDSSDSSYANHCDSANGYNYACIKDSGSTETGVWYNFTAASAGTITTNNNTNVATSSLCPKGWHIPTGPATDTSSEFYKIFQSTAANTWVNANDYLNAFKAVTDGYYYNGSLNNTDYVRWWSATALDATTRYRLQYSDSRFSSKYDGRYLGYFLRCIAD